MDSAQELKHSVFREAHLRDYWKVIWQGRWTVLAVFAIVVAATAVWSLLQTPIYRATATVEIQPKPRGVLTGQDVSGLGAAGYGWFAEEKYHNTQIDIIKSRDIAERVVRLLDLRSHPSFAEAPDPVGAFRQMIQVDPRRDTGLLEISMQGADPDEVTRWANAVAQAFVTRNFEKASENVQKAVDSIRRQITALQEDVAEAEAQRLGTLQETAIFDAENQKEIVRMDLEKYSKELSTAQIQLHTLEDTLEQIRQIEAAGGDLLQLSQLAQDETLRGLERQKVEVERQIETLKDEFKEAHPQLKARRRELAKLEQWIEDRRNGIVNGLEKDRQSWRQQAKFLVEQIAEAERNSLELATKTSKYEMVKTDSETKRAIFELIHSTMNEVQLGAELMTNNVAILDDAVPPRFAIKPQKRVNVMIGAALGLFLGLGAVFFLEYLDNTIRTPEDVEKYLKLSVLGVIPKMAEQGLGARPIREAYQSLRTSIIFSSKNRQRKVLLVTSTGPQEGKSSSVANLGRTLAAAGDRVVIVDCDMRRPTQHLHHGVDREPGLTNYVSAPEGDHDWRTFVKPVTPANLHLLACGPLPPNPPELLGNERFTEMLASLRESYDWILLDSPPAASLADAALLASMADMLVIVVRHNSTDRDLVVKTVQQLRGVNPTIAGAVLNNVDLERSYNKDYYYAGYYYYSEDDTSNKASRKRRVDRKAQVG